MRKKDKKSDADEITLDVDCEKRQIVLDNQIDNDIVKEAIIPLQDMDNDGSGKPIEIIINSNGGEIVAGFALIDAIEKLKSPTTIRICGMAASMACLIAMSHSGNPNVTTICSKYSVGLMHGGSISLGEMPTSQAKDFFYFNEEYGKIVREYVLTHSAIDEKLYDVIERCEFWMTADKMLEYGIVSKIE